jgi:hypothetical protein
MTIIITIIDDEISEGSFFVGKTTKYTMEKLIAIMDDLGI